MKKTKLNPFPSGDRDFMMESEYYHTFPSDGDLHEHAWYKGIPCIIDKRVYEHTPETFKMRLKSGKVVKSHPFKVRIDFYDGTSKVVERNEVTPRDD